jgi:hypothetical protein
MLKRAYRSMFGRGPSTMPGQAGRALPWLPSFGAKFLRGLEHPAESLADWWEGARRSAPSSAGGGQRQSPVPPVGSPMAFVSRSAELPGQRVPRATGPLGAHAALQQVIESLVFPALVARHAPLPSIEPPFEPRVAELAQLLIADCPHGAAERVAEAYATAGSLVRLLTTVIEPAARRLGDLWGDDRCSEFDLTRGLGRLQAAVHLLDVPRVPALSGRPGVVLIAPQPGEAHMLNAALHAELAWQADWDIRVAFPATDNELQELLAGSWFDLLDLSLSAAFRREHWVARMESTIAQARRASLNPALVVAISGRLFEDADTGHIAGADSCNRTAGHFGWLLGEMGSRQAKFREAMLRAITPAMTQAPEPWFVNSASTARP